jgi:citrate lyase beta subunit
MSRHLTEYNIVPAGAVIRINLAWEPDEGQLKQHIEELTHHIFLDVPSGRIKPPNTHWEAEKVILIANAHQNIRYLGISNVEHSEQLMYWICKAPQRVNIVPKIETIKGVMNIEEICGVLKLPRTIMLDHDDLFADLLKNSKLPEILYTKFINPLVNFCTTHNVRLLRTAGVVFSDR